MGDELSFGNLLRTCRVKAGLTQEGLAVRSGLSVRGLSDLERGARQAPYRDTLLRLIDALQLDAADCQELATAASRHRRGAGAFRAPRAVGHLAVARAALHNLPTELSSFVGRVEEVAQVHELLTRTRLLTLTGPGGVGKTRLALQVAARLREEPTSTGNDERPGVRIMLVELAALMDADLVLPVLATALGVAEQPGRPLLEALVESLQYQPLLLLLDSCEHLVAACATLGEHLLRRCPALQVLATSRAPLGVQGETVWRVPPLSLVEAGQGMCLDVVHTSDAGRLFMDRAAAALPNFTPTDSSAPLIAGICRRLGGIPLAIELAAARVPVLSVKEILDRLDDALGLLITGPQTGPSRQQTLRATLDWSYGLLSAPEQQLFDRLGVFAGDWTLAAAEMIGAGGSIQRKDILDLLARLLDKSLVLREPSTNGSIRYRLLEPVRQFAQQQLGSGDLSDAISRQHAEYYLELAERTEVEFHTPASAAALALLDREYDNLRAVLRWLIARGDAERVQRLAGALGRFWFYRGYLAEGQMWLTQALALPDGRRLAPGRAKCLRGAALVALSRGEYARAEAADREALALWRELGNAAEEGWALFHLGQAARLRGDSAAARVEFEASVAVSRAAGDGAAEATGLAHLGLLAYELDQDEEARSRAEDGLARATAVGWAHSAVMARLVLGQLSQRQGDSATAQDLLEAALDESRQLGARWWNIMLLIPLGHIALERGDSSSAHAWLAEGLRLALEIGERPGVARGLEGFAQLASAQAQPKTALTLAGAAAALRSTLAAPLLRPEETPLDRSLSAARRAVTTRQAASAWAEGSALSLEQAVAIALSVSAHASPADPPAGSPGDMLTAREQEVAVHIARGLTNAQIAHELIIGDRTVQSHVGSILNKLGMSSRAQVGGWMAERRLLDSPIGDTLSAGHVRQPADGAPSRQR